MSSPSTNINDTFFEGIYKDVWRKLIPAGLSEAECDLLQDVAHLAPGDKVLDLMCGYGRHALELARRGFTLTAVDNSAGYISEVKSVAEDEGLAVETVSNSALEMQLNQQYKAAICMGNSFAFFNREDAVQLLKKIAAHLQNDGILMINSWMIAEIAIKHFREKEWYEVDGYKYMLDYRFQFQPSRIESEHTILSKKGEIEIIQGVDYIFTLSEMEVMFNEAGLKTKELYSTPRKRPFKMGDNRIYIVVQKKD